MMYKTIKRLILISALV